MALIDNKITEKDLSGKGVKGLPDTPNLSTSEMQAKFEEIVREVIIPKFNSLVESIDDIDVTEFITSMSRDRMMALRLNEYDQLEFSADGQEWRQVASGKQVLDPQIEATTAKNAYKLGGYDPSYYKTDSITNDEIDSLFDSEVTYDTQTTVSTTNYNALTNKPAIDGNTLYSNTKLSDIGVSEVTNSDIDSLLD